MTRELVIAATIGAAALASSASAWGQVIHRCEERGRTIYSDRPCQGRPVERFAVPAAQKPRGPSPEAPVDAQRDAPKAPANRTIAIRVV